MTTFAKYFKPEDMARLVDFGKANPRPDGSYDDPKVKAYYDKVSEAREEIVVKAAMKFLKAKLKAGELKPVPNSLGRKVGFAQSWDVMVTGDGEQHRKKWALEEMSHVFAFILISPGVSIYKAVYADELEPGETLDVEGIYLEFVAFMDAGDFPWWTTNLTASCGITGDYLSVQFEGWTPVLGKGTARKFEPCVPVAPATSPQTLQIEFPTGDLVAMDWFRDDENILRDYVRARSGGLKRDVNSEAGVVESTRLHAELGMVHVMVGNSSPNVFTGEGLIAVGNNWREYTADGRTRYSDCDDDGNESEEAADAYEFAQENPPEGMVDEGRVCTDLWWVTIVERQRLVEMLVEHKGEEFRAKAEAYAAGGFDVEMRVEPGKYTLHFDGYPSTFYERLDDKTKFRIGTPYFALTKDPA